MAALAETANEFLALKPDDADRMRFSGDRYADASDRLIGQLRRHLDDEEDIVVPLVLDRGEGPLGMD